MELLVRGVYTQIQELKDVEAVACYIRDHCRGLLEYIISILQGSCYGRVRNPRRYKVPGPEPCTFGFHEPVLYFCQTTLFLVARRTYWQTLVHADLYSVRPT